jgi:DNA (cytosine-5)-methyltransferase 1
MEYGQPPESAFQAKVRGGSGQLLDHMCKKMDDINLTRCK